MRLAIITIILLMALSAFADQRELAQPADNYNHPAYKPKSYAIAVPLAFFAGFGSGHFYAKDIWGGIRYIAYDTAGLGFGFLTLYLDDYSERSIIFAVGLAVVNRIYQAVSAAESVYYYNKNPLLRELDIFDSERRSERLVMKGGHTIDITLLTF